MRKIHWISKLSSIFALITSFVVLTNCSNTKLEINFTGSTHAEAQRSEEEISITFSGFSLINGNDKSDLLLGAYAIFSDYDSFEAKIRPTQDNHFNVVVSSQVNKNIPNGRYLFNLIIYDKQKEISLFNQIFSFSVSTSLLIPDIHKTDFVYLNDKYQAIYPGFKLFNGLSPYEYGFSIKNASSELGTLTIDINITHDDSNFCEFDLIMSTTSELEQGKTFSYDLVIESYDKKIEKFLEAKYDTVSSFNDDTWENVAYWASTNIDFMRARYNNSMSMVGMTKDIYIDNCRQSVIVIGENHDDLLDGVNKAMLTFKFETCFFHYVQDPQDPETFEKIPVEANWNDERVKPFFSWERSNVRRETWKMKEIIDEAMGLSKGGEETYLKQVKKPTSISSDNVFQIQDLFEWVWCLSSTEIGCGKPTESSDFVWPEEGKCYEYFEGIDSWEENEKRKCNRHIYDHNIMYWLRSICMLGEGSYTMVGDGYGKISSQNVYYIKFDIVPCFCI